MKKRTGNKGLCLITMHQKTIFWPNFKPVVAVYDIVLSRYFNFRKSWLKKGMLEKYRR